MFENPKNTDAQKEVLKKIVGEVSELYRNRVVTETSANCYPRKWQYQDWPVETIENGQYSDKIHELKQTIDRGLTGRFAYLGNIASTVSRHFDGITDQSARELLGELLFARISCSNGSLDHSMLIYLEVLSIIEEVVGVSKTDSEELRNVSLEQVVSSVLTDKLKLTRQTQLASK